MKEKKKFQWAAKFYSWFYSTNYNGHYTFSVNVKCVCVTFNTPLSFWRRLARTQRALDHCGWPRPAPLRLLTLKNAERACKVSKVFSAHGSASEGSVKWHRCGSDCRGGFLHLKSQKETWTPSLRCPKRRLFSPGGLSRLVISAFVLGQIHLRCCGFV